MNNFQPVPGAYDDQGAWTCFQCKRKDECLDFKNQWCINKNSLFSSFWSASHASAPSITCQMWRVEKVSGSRCMSARCFHMTLFNVYKNIIVCAASISGRVFHKFLFRPCVCIYFLSLPSHLKEYFGVRGNAQICFLAQRQIRRLMPLFVLLIWSRHTVMLSTKTANYVIYFFLNIHVQYCIKAGLLILTDSSFIF